MWKLLGKKYQKIGNDIFLRNRDCSGNPAVSVGKVLQKFCKHWNEELQRKKQKNMQNCRDFRAGNFANWGLPKF